ncbi:MAG: hypothetical protein ACJ72D_20560 [Marmoricola sp.]
MRNISKILVAGVIATTSALGIQPAAEASGAFTWSFRGDYGIYSRHFTQPRESNIYVKISRWSPCVIGGDYVDIYVYLYKDDRFDNTVGTTKKVTCAGTAKWSMVNPGTYYFRLVVEGSHRSQGTTFVASGTVFYDGSAP